MPANAPTNLVLTPSGTSIALNWDSNQVGQSATAEIYRSLDGGSTFSKVWVMNAVGPSTWTDTFLYNSTAYYYKITQTLDDGIRSSFSNTANATTDASASAPSTPTIDFLETAGVSLPQVILHFVSGPGSGERFIVERCAGTGCSGFASVQWTRLGSGSSILPGNYLYAVGSSVTDGGTQTGAGLTPLSKCTYYRYRVLAVNATGNSTYSNQIEIQTPCDVNVPLTPFGLTATTISSSQINLAWNDNSSNELGFNIEYSVYDGFIQNFTPFSVLTTVTTDTEAYNHTGLAPATTYRYRVQAFNNNGVSAYSNIATATTSAGSVAIIAPTNLVGVVESGPQVKLTWSQTSTNETGFKVERADSGGAFVVIASLGANVITYTDSLVQDGTTYQYRVFAFNATDTSAYAGPITVSVSSGGLSGSEYAFEQFYGSNNGYTTQLFLSRNIVIVNNYMENNGVGHIDPDLKVAPNCTIDNPASESLQIRRGVVVNS